MLVTANEKSEELQRDISVATEELKRDRSAASASAADKDGDTPGDDEGIRTMKS